MSEGKKTFISYCLVAFFCLGISFQNGYSAENIIYTKKSGELQFVFNYSATTPYLHPPLVSGVINDATDPAAKLGIVVDVKEGKNIINAADYSLTANSNNIAVVNKDKVIITKSDGMATIKIIPSGVGFSDITLTLTKGKNSASIVINYAASAIKESSYKTYYHTGSSDASAVVALDSNTMLVGDDEANQLYIYNTTSSGLPVNNFSYERYVSLRDGSMHDQKEVDVEACARSIKYPSSVYWLGSMSNGGKRFEVKDNRNTLFATYIKGTGKDLTINCSAAYHQLRKYLIEWGDSYGYNFSASAESGQKPKQVGGFNVEGLSFGPDSTTLYICFRAPQVPVSSRNNAVIAPLLNFEGWFNEGKPKSKPVFGKSIELNLDKRGIRDMIVLSDKSYLIIAGNADHIRNTALYKWSGKENETPVLLNIPDIKELPAEGVFEILNNGQPTGKIQLICDDGTTEWYNDGNAAKNMDAGFKKFRSVVVNIGIDKIKN